MLRIKGAGAAVSRYGVPAGGSSRADVGSKADETWRAWAAEAPRRRIMVAAVIDCLAEPRTLAEIEQAHRMRKGQAFANYAAGVDLWCELRGWVRATPIGALRLRPEGVA